MFSVNNPNYNNSDKSLYTILKATETDRLSNFGYKSNLIGLELGTKFQYLKQFNFGLSGDHFMKIYRQIPLLLINKKQSEIIGIRSQVLVLI